MLNSRHYIMLFFLVSLLGCMRENNSTTVRKDLFENIKGFIEFSEERAKRIDNGREDTDIYWVYFSEVAGDNFVIIMQQPYYDSVDTDGFLNVNENLVFFYNSNTSMIKTDNLKHKIPTDMPNQNSKESGLGYSAPNWAYIITEDGLEKTFIGE